LRLHASAIRPGSTTPTKPLAPTGAELGPESAAELGPEPAAEPPPESGAEPPAAADRDVEEEAQPETAGTDEAPSPAALTVPPGYSNSPDPKELYEVYIQERRGDTWLRNVYSA